MKTYHITTQRGTCRAGTDCFLAAVMSLAALLFCSTTPLVASEPALENEEDAAITSLVKQSLLYHLMISSKTETNGGVVTLSGSVDDIVEKELGTSLASEINGVKRVINLMLIPTALAGNDR